MRRFCPFCEGEDLEYTHKSGANLHVHHEGEWREMRPFSAEETAKIRAEMARLEREIEKSQNEFILRNVEMDSIN